MTQPRPSIHPHPPSLTMAKARLTPLLCLLMALLLPPASANDLRCNTFMGTDSVQGGPGIETCPDIGNPIKRCVQRAYVLFGVQQYGMSCDDRTSLTPPALAPLQPLPHLPQFFSAQTCPTTHAARSMGAAWTTAQWSGAATPISRRPPSTAATSQTRARCSAQSAAQTPVRTTRRSTGARREGPGGRGCCSRLWWSW